MTDLHYTTTMSKARPRSSRQPSSRSSSDLLRSVGLAVRQARGERDLTRKALAARSSVSERFLAQIEGGNGNVSLLRLADLARALDVPLLRLLSSFTAGDGARPARRLRLALVGLRGAGKSTIGRLPARRLKTSFLELDAEIEKTAGLPIAQIFELHGERYFRRLEREVLARLAASERPLVLATGGGLVTDPETYALLRSAFTTVWLSAD